MSCCHGDKSPCKSISHYCLGFLSDCSLVFFQGSPGRPGPPGLHGFRGIKGHHGAKGYAGPGGEKGDRVNTFINVYFDYLLYNNVITTIQ